MSSGCPLVATKPIPIARRGVSRVSLEARFAIGSRDLRIDTDGQGAAP